MIPEILDPRPLLWAAAAEPPALPPDGFFYIIYISFDYIY